MADNEIRNPAKAYFKWKMPVITKSEDDWNFWNTEDKYNRTLFIGYNDTTTPHVASLFMIVDGKPMQAVGDDVLARISKMETDVAEALADIQVLIDRVNAQQLEISNLQQECERVLAQAADAVLDARTWAEGTDEEVADLGGEHSAKGWAQKANEIVSSGLPSDASFEHITVTGNSKFGQDPDRENQPGLEIEGTGEIQAYRAVNMHNGATIEYAGTVDMPWSDSSNKVPNTAWVQRAVQHGTIDPNSELTCKRITARDKGAYLMTAYTSTTGSKQQASLSLPKVTSDTGLVSIELKASNAADNTSGQFVVYPHFIQVAGHQVNIRGTATAANYNAPVVFGSTTISAAETKKIMSSYVGHFANGLITGLPDTNWGDGIPFRVVRPKAVTGSWEAVFGITPTVPDITDAADSSSKVPNTKWVQAAIAAGGGTGGGAVTSVNGKTGEVVLSAADVGAAPADALAGYVTTDALSTELADYATNASVNTKLGSYQPKLTAGDGIAISDTNVISVTGGGTGGGAVSSVNGKTGEVVLNAADVGAITGAEADAKITTALEPYAKTADVTTTLASYAKSADVTAEINTAVAPLATTEALTLGLKGKQDTLTAGDGITISADNVISATGGGTGGGAVDSVNGKTGAVVLTGEDIKTSSYPESATIVTTFASFAQMIETKQDKITATTALVAGSYDTDVGTYYTHIGENGLQVNDSSAVNRISLNMDDGLITPTNVSFTGANKTFTVAGTSIFNGKAAFTKPVTTTNTVSMLNGSAPLLSVGASGVRVNLTNATKFDCYTSADGTDTSVCTITDGGIHTINATFSSVMTVNGAASLSSVGNIFEAETTCAGELKTTSNVTSTLWGADGEQTVLSLDTTGQTFKVSSVGGTDMLNCNLATGMVNLPGMTLTPADGESSATINAYVPITAKSIASTDAASLQGGFISTGYSAIQGVMGLFFQDDDWVTYAIISPSNTSFANLVLTDEIPPGDNSNRAPTTAWVKNAITTAVQSKADAADTVTTNTVQTITGAKVFTTELRKKSTVIDVTTQPENYTGNNAVRFLDKNDKITGFLENAQQADGKIKTGIHARNKDGYQPHVDVIVPPSGTTGAYATAPNTPANAPDNAIATVDWVRSVAGGPSKNDSVTTAFSGSITSRTYTIYKNGNLWSIHVTCTLNVHTLNNGTTEEWAFLSDVSDDADVTKLLAGQVLFMNAYISGCTSAAQPGYYAIGVTAIRMEDGDLKAKLRSFDSAVTSIPAGLELSFDLTTWVSN